MKKIITLFVALIASALLLSSCHKEGQYLPKKKIVRIERSSSEGVSEIEDWAWNGKLLSNITIKTGGGDLINESTFKYTSDKRVESIRVNFVDFVYNYVFTYDGKDLVKISRQEEGSDDVDVYTFKKVDDHVVEITLAPVESKSLDKFNVLRFILPTEVADQIKPSEAKATTTYRLTWKGDNVTQMDVLSNGVSAMKTTWKYDDKINPFNGLYSDASLRSKDMLYSANNIIGESVTLQIMGMETVTNKDFEYTYDGKYPVERTWISDGLLHQIKHTEKFYYK